MASQEELDRVGMASARLWSTLSTCSRLSVGCVIADRRGRIVSSGYNGAPAGQPHCDHSCDCGSNFIGGYCLAECKSKQPCQIATHSEDNALRYSAEPVISFTMYCTHSPCTSCALRIIDAKIARVVYEVAYRNTHPLLLLEEHGIMVQHYERG